MNKIVLYDNKIYDWIYKIVNMMYVSLLWLIFSLPVVTLGASTTALYYVVNKTIRHERGKIFHGFWHSFKTNFKQSTIIWLCLVIICGIGGIDYLVLRGLNLNGKINSLFLWILVIFLVIIGMIANYFFPYIARFKNTTSQIIKNSILIAMMNFGKSFVNIVLFLIAIVISVFVPYSIVICPALYMLILSYSLEKIFEKYMSPEDLEEEEKRNMKYV